MHYFKKNIGDYAKKTGRLSMLQHGAYTLLIDSCYDRERFPTLEEAIEWTWASTKEEVEAVEFVLRKFFSLVDGVYVQNRIQEEIDAYHEKAKTNKRIADEREANRKAKDTNRAPSVNEAPPNQEPRTKNHKPKIKPIAQIPSGFSRFWEVYPKKKSKGDAERAFKTIKPDEHVLEKIIQAIERAKTSIDWLKEGGQFIPYPATWLRAKGWEDSDLGAGLTLAPSGEVKPWWQSVAGITAKGKEIGLVQTEDNFVHFRDRVYKAAGNGPWNQQA